MQRKLIKNKNHKALALNLFQDMQESNIEYIYRGEFNTAITDSILSLAETNLDDSKDSIKIRKRVYFILVEGLQNITRHQEEAETDESTPGLLVIQRKDKTYQITTGNLILSENIPHLTTLLVKINSLDKKELKDYYRKILNTRSFSEKGGAGLGLIEIARKSGNKLSYTFKKVSDEYSYFYMQTKIQLDKQDDENSPCNEDCIQNITKLHHTLDEQKILLNFSGIFNQDKLISLLSIIEGHMRKIAALKNKIFNLMVELLQNIVHHADDYTFNNIAGHYGIFFISERKDGFTLTTGNYIKNEKIPPLKAKFDSINNLQQKELSRLHFQTLLSYKEKKSHNIGLGIIDMRIKSKNPFVYYFYPVNDEFSFFSIQVTITKRPATQKKLLIEPTTDTPKIILSEDEPAFLFSGSSYPENTEQFYRPVIEWLMNYAKNPKSFSVFEFRLKFYSSATEKIFIDIMQIIQEISEKSAVIIKWYYNKYDEDAFEFALQFSKLIDIQFNIIGYTYK